MARDLTVEELVALRAHISVLRHVSDAGAPSAVREHLAPMLAVLVDCLGESADLTLLARKHFNEAAGR